jgi:hypothetical protein
MILLIQCLVIALYWFKVKPISDLEVWQLFLPIYYAIALGVLKSIYEQINKGS